MRSSNLEKKAEAFRAAQSLSKLAAFEDIDRLELEDIPSAVASGSASILSGIPIMGPVGASAMDFLTAPEGRGVSRALHSLAGGTTGFLGGAALGEINALRPYSLPLMVGGGLAGGFAGREASRDRDPALMRLARAMGLERVIY